jgi:hypothetical protein
VGGRLGLEEEIPVGFHDNIKPKPIIFSKYDFRFSFLSRIHTVLAKSKAIGFSS